MSVYNLVEVRLGDIKTRYDGGVFGMITNFFYKRYDWGGLRLSIKENGYDPEKYGYILLKNKTKEDELFRLWDGHHRVKIMKELFGEDKLIVAQTYDKEITKKAIDVIPIRQIPTIIVMLTMIKPFIVGTTLSWLILVILPETKQKSVTDTHPIKGMGWIFETSKVLYKVIMWIYYNIRFILMATLLVGMAIWLIKWYLPYLILLIVVRLLTENIEKLIPGIDKYTISEIINKIKGND